MLLRLKYVMSDSLFARHVLIVIILLAAKYFTVVFNSLICFIWVCNLTINPYQGTEVFYAKGTRALVTSYYESSFPRLLLATALHANLSDEGSPSTVFLLLGVAVRALCGRIDDQGAVKVLLAIEQLVCG